MKKLIKNLITRLLWDSVNDIMNPILEDKLYPIVIFYADGHIIETRNMFTIPRVGDEVWILGSLYIGDAIFKCEKVIIVSKLGYEVRLEGTMTLIE